MTTGFSTSFSKGFLFVFGSQMVVFISGLIKALVVPVLLGLSDFGYWQIYIFYTLYIGVFTFGYGDGLYLKYGGCKFEELPLSRLRTANALYLALMTLGAIALLIFAYFNSDPQRQFVFVAIAVNVAVLGAISNISLTLQATNQLKGYAFLNSADKMFFVLALLLLFQEDFRTFRFLIAADISAKFVVLALLLNRYRKLFLGPLAKLAEGVNEFQENVGAGVQLLLANLSGMLVLGVGRLIVEYFGTLESYAYYAFAVSLANVVLLSVTALSITIYPILRRQPKENFLGFFNKTTNAYAAFTLIMLTGYFPAVMFIELIAKQYGPVLHFLNAIFIITVLQGKMQLVNNTYYKALRLERAMLVANVASLLAATVLSLVGFLLTQSVLAIAYAALVTMVFRVYASEIFLRRHMNDALDLRQWIEVSVLGLFLFITLLFAPIIASVVWIVFVLFIAVSKRNELSELWHQVRGTRQ